ncbi:uncharacterized protein VTP21DRAFT_1742 [Calcarisporiella thermophila]|uniref:uncharacterized protein n=1 Tax=Calcarisporiella thermophila TaxID=911321 RepID=UPI003743DDB9
MHQSGAFVDERRGVISGISRNYAFAPRVLTLFRPRFEFGPTCVWGLCGREHPEALLACSPGACLHPGPDALGGPAAAAEAAADAQARNAIARLLFVPALHCDCSAHRQALGCRGPVLFNHMKYFLIRAVWILHATNGCCLFAVTFFFPFSYLWSRPKPACKGPARGSEGRLIPPDTLRSGFYAFSLALAGFRHRPPHPLPCSMAEPPDEEALQQRLKAAIWYSVSKLSEEQASELGMTISPQFVASLADLVYKQAESLAVDLEQFARHAKRTTITMDDVKLCARRNEALYQLIAEGADEISKSKELRKRRR